MNAYADFGLFAPSTGLAPKPLREHQLRAMGMLRQSLRTGLKRPVCQIATGGGKTRLSAEIVNAALKKGKRVAFTVPAISLVGQTIEAFENEGIRSVGVMQANHVLTDSLQPVQVVSVQTLARRDRPDVDMVIVDEAHLRFTAISDWIKDEPSKVFIGLSATPWARGMAEDYETLIVPVTMQELIDQGYLSPFRVFAPSHPDMSGVAIRNGDYAEAGAADVMGGLVGDVVTTWLARAERRPTLVFAVNRAHASLLVDQFALSGVRMGYCDANTDLVERELLLKQVRRGQLAGIVSIRTMTTGVDAPFVSCIVDAAPTRSEMLHVQKLGRGLRTADDKVDCLILDHADNHARHGFVTDIHHSALLGGKDKTPRTKQEKGEPMPKECGKCGLLKPPKVRECPKCGFVPTRQSEVETEEGELVEITRKPKPTRDDKQRFWSMALCVDQARGKGGRLAKALYKSKWGVWPKGLISEPIKPDGAFESYVRSRQIAYAKSKHRRAA